MRIHSRAGTRARFVGTPGRSRRVGGAMLAAVLLGALLPVASALVIVATEAPATAAGAATTAYVANYSDNTVTPIDITTNTAGPPIAVGALPFGVAVSPDGTKAYVTNYWDSTMTPIDTTTNTPGPAITVGSYSGSVAFTPDGTRAYVASAGENAVTPITVATDTPGTAIPVGNSPGVVAISPDGTKAYVVNQFSNSVTPITVATDTPGSPIPVGARPYGVAFSPDGTKAYVTNANSDSVTPITVATDAPGTPIPVGAHPFTVAFSPDGTKAYVANLFSGTVTPIAVATDTPGPPIQVGLAPGGIAMVSGPIVNAVSPVRGPAAGGTTVTITGARFTAASAVKFGTTNATSYILNSSSSITATSPAHALGTVDVAVVTPGGTSAISDADRFRYTAASSRPFIYGPRHTRVGDTVVKRIVVRATDDTGPAPTGLVSLYRIRNSSRRWIGRGYLHAGTTTITLTDLPRGADKIYARYRGDMNYQPSQRSTTQVVRRART